MNHTERARESRNTVYRKLLSYGYALVNMAMAFVAVWTVYGAVRVCVTLSEDIYWLSKAFIQQMTIIVAMLFLMIGTLVAQHGYEAIMNNKKTWLPRSFVVVSACNELVYAVSKIIILTY